MVIVHRLHSLVSGRVQGVWYRASTQQQASRLGLGGFVRNLPDRRVEVQAWGEEKALRELEAWLWQGPVNAEVTDVTTKWDTCDTEIGDFKIG